MRSAFLTATNLNDAWYQLLYKLFEKDEAGGFKHSYVYKITKGSYAGQRRQQLVYAAFEILHPSTRPLAPQIPEQFKDAKIAPPTDDEQIEQYLPYLMTNVLQINEEYTYGERLSGCWMPVRRLIPGGKSETEMIFVNQLEEIVRKYEEDGHGTNQAAMEVGMPSDVLLTDPPCLRVADTMIVPRDGEEYLDMSLYFRSWDLFEGLPVNLGGVQLLKEILADEIGVKDGRIYAASQKLHLYDHSGKAAVQLTHKLPEIIQGLEGT